jgi:hypothetical protein
MKKHSPNFFENLQEADTANNNRATTFFWTVVFITTLMLGFSLTSCNEQKRPIKVTASDGWRLSFFYCDSINISEDRRKAIVYIDSISYKIYSDEIRAVLNY